MPSLSDMIGGKPEVTPGSPVNLPGVEDLVSIEDVSKLRDNIFNRVQTAAQNRFPIENNRYKIELGNVKYKGNKPFSKAAQKDALLKQGSLNWRLYGDWRMLDRATGAVVDERKGELVAHVPYLTERGTFIRNGNEYTLSNQSRLRAGAYARRKRNGELESHFNILDGGRSFHMVMDPITTEFTMRVGGAKLKVAPILRAMGVTSEQLKEHWGNEILNRNNVDDATSAKRAIAQFYRGADQNVKLADVFAGMKLDPEITQQTLGTPYENVTQDALLRATRKLIDISRGAAQEDDRDALHYQQLMFPDDLLAERIEKDWDRRVTGKTLWTSTNRGKLAVSSGHLTPQLDAVFTKSGLASPIEEVNPMEVLDQRYRVMRTGEGGISEAGIPTESRAVQPSHFGMVDPLKTPESLKLGVDSRFTINTSRGKDGIYTNLRGLDGKVVPVPVKMAITSVVAFPGELAGPGKRVRAMVNGKLQYVDRNLVNYELPHTTHMFTVGTNLIPMLSGVAGQRVSMGSRFISQALAMKDPEAPLVQAMSDDGISSFEELYGTKAAAAVRSDVAGRVSKVTNDAIFVDTPKGMQKYELYNNFAYNRKSALHNTAVVKPGDHVTPGDLLARSNFTDQKGTLALGTNLRVAFMPWKGLNYEDAFVISRTAANKLTSEHLYPVKVDHDTHTQRGVKEYTALFPTNFTRDQAKRLDDEGVIKVGQRVHKGDPLVLAVRERPQSDIHRGHKPGWADASEIWDHESEGFVTDVDKSKNGVRVHVKTYKPLQEADKIAIRHGGKGVVARVIPDEQMPHDAEGNPIEVLSNPMGVVTRQNPAQLVEAILGKIARKTGKSYKMPAFMPPGQSLIDFAIDEAKRHGVSDTEELTDPSTGRKFKGIMTGSQFFMKLHFLAEKKKGARDTGGYTYEDMPSRGGPEGAKKLGVLDINAMLSHGATSVLKDAKTVRGQKNDNYWRAFQMGHTPPSPEVPMVYKKFLGHMIASGINVRKSGTQLNIMALRDKDIDELSRGEIRDPRGVNANTMKEIEGGLFDKGITGGHNGTNWSHIKLDEPLPNPIMEEPIRRLLGMTQNQLESVLSGTEKLNGRTGGAAIKEALARIKLPDLKRKTEEIINSGVKSRRSDAIKTLSYINMMEKTGLDPQDFVLNKVPVLPPVFRPIAATSNFVIKTDANSLYVDLMKHNEALRDMKQSFGKDGAGEERLNLYKSFKALTGLGDSINPKLKNQGVTGLLKQVFGPSSPKLGMFQYRVLGGTVDQAGLAVVTPNPSLNMDEVGMPEGHAWTLYKKFVVRKLVQRGMKPTEAIKAVKNKSAQAADVLDEVMADRPVIVNRAPTLHKYNLMAFYPQLVKGNTLNVSPLVTGGFNMDFDGNCVDFDTEITCVITKSVVNSSSYGQEFLASLEKESMMRTIGETEVTVVDDVEIRTMKIGEFPRVGPPAKDKNGADVYMVPDGVHIVSYDHSSCMIQLLPITRLTVERDKDCREVKTTRGKSVIVSDNESLCVVDPDTGDLRKETPDRAAGLFVPCIKGDPCLGSKHTKTIGWWYGSFISDGWTTERMVGYAKSEKAKRDEFIRIARSEICDNFTYHEYTGSAGPNKLGDSVKLHLTGDLVKCVTGCYTDGVGTGKKALHKRIPREFFDEGSRDFLVGLLSGLLDGDGTLTWNTAKKAKRMSIRMSTSSKQLAEDMVRLCYKLGIRASITTVPPRNMSNTAYIVCPSIPDMQDVLPELYMVGDRERAIVEEFMQCEKVVDKLDVIPIPANLAAEMASIALAKKRMSWYGTLRKRADGVNVSMSRNLLCKIIESISDEEAEGLGPMYSRLKAMAAETGVLWERIDSVEPAGAREVFDFEIPGTKVYSLSNGLVIYDTALMHVPVSDDAVKEAKEKMMPSRNLFAIRDFGVHYLPSQEYAYGLFLASNKKKPGVAKAYADIKSVIAAYKKGDIDADDRIRVGKK